MNKLKEEMSRQHITGYKLAQMTGISNPDIYRCLSGKQEMFKGWKTRIADALGCKVEELFPEGKDGKHDE